MNRIGVMGLEFLRLGHKRAAAAWLSLSQIALSGGTRRCVARMPKQPCREAHVRRNRCLPPTASTDLPGVCVSPLRSRPSSQLSLEMTAQPTSDGTPNNPETNLPSQASPKIPGPQKMPEIVFPAILSH